jgi:sugar-specific transcriptional regulator TrmB
LPGIIAASWVIKVIIIYMDQQIVSQLQSLNLSLNEAKVYEALLQIGQTSAGEIIKRVQLHRSVVYETLDKLIDKKLVFKLEKGSIAHFQVTDPARILQNIKSQEEIALDLIPKLKDLVDTKLPEITVYEGIEAYKRFWIDSAKRLPEGSTDYGAGSIGQLWWDYMGKDAETYFKISVKKKIKWKLIIFTKTPLDVELLRKYPTLQEQRIIEKGTASEGNFNILGEESVVLHSATEPLIIEIKNPTLVRVFQNIFDLLWSIGKPI